MGYHCKDLIKKNKVIFKLILKRKCKGGGKVAIFILIFVPKINIKPLDNAKNSKISFIFSKRT